MPLHRTLIDDWGIPMQQQTADLAIIAPVDNVLNLVRIEWPAVDGQALLSDEIEEWLNDRRLVWRCLCPDLHGSRRAAVFDRNPNMDISVMCPNRSRGCGFQVDLDRIIGTTHLLSSDYSHFEPGQTASEYQAALSTHSRIGSDEDRFLHPNIPVFFGFCGEHEDL